MVENPPSSLIFLGLIKVRVASMLDKSHNRKGFKKRISSRCPEYLQLK